jgi:hypothetical protein
MRLQLLEEKSVILKPCQHPELKHISRCNMPDQDGMQTDTEEDRMNEPNNLLEQKLIAAHLVNIFAVFMQPKIHYRAGHNN